MKVSKSPLHGRAITFLPRYVVALAAVGTTLLVRLLLEPVLKEAAPFILSTLLGKQHADV